MSKTLVGFVAMLTFAGCTPMPISQEGDMAVATDGGGGADLASGGCSPKCSGVTPFCNATKHCVSCTEDSQCLAGSYCKVVSDAVAICTPGCMTDDRCANGQKCCNSQCVDTATDARHCGMCGTACMASHSGATCVAGMCAAGKCDPGWGDCDKDAMNGCEANLHADPNNCTGCGMVCAIANAFAGCADGCYATACKFGFDDCNLNAMDGCETSVLSDKNNCGACGKSCVNLPNAQAACINGTCQLSMCNVGYFDCDGNANNGCEVKIDSDVKNCGKCGNACAVNLVCTNGGCTCPQCNFPNASSVCVNNVCMLDKCNTGFANCDGNNVNGCEVNTDNDANNCSKCAMVCPMNLPFCGMGQCQAMPLGCFRITDVQQIGPQKAQYTKCEQVLDNGFTCVNPLIRYGNVPNGVPGMHGNNDFPTWCKQVGCKGYVVNSVKYGMRNYMAPFGKLFWCAGYDEPAVKWCDWQDGTWFNMSLDYHPQQANDAVTQITCN